MSMSYPARTAFFLFLDLAAVQVGDLALHRLDGLHLVHRLDVQVHDEGTFHVEKIRQHPVVQLRGQNLHEADGPVLLSHAELLAGAELEAGRSDKVFGWKGRWGPASPTRTGTAPARPCGRWRGAGPAGLCRPGPRRPRPAA